MLIVTLAWRDLMRDRFFLFCNVAVIVGILVPLLVLLGVKNGVYAALVGEMLNDPRNLQIDTLGNAAFSEADISPMRDWPEVAFLTPKVRGQFDYMNVRAKDGRRMRPALIIPSGQGDPTLPEGLDIGPGEVVASAQLAAQLGLETGMELQLISQAEGRPKQLVLPVRLVAVLPDAAASGRAVLARFDLLDLIEAYYDSYSLPDYSITGTRDLAERVPSYEGVRLYARRLEDLAPLQARVETQLSIGTSARTRDVTALLGLGRKLDLALGLTVALAALGLGAALVLGFWSDVSRKKSVLASIALLGVSGRVLAMFPVVQALISCVLGVAISVLLYHLAGQVAGVMFGPTLTGSAPLTHIPFVQWGAICSGLLVLVLGAVSVAAWSALRLDPAHILREGK